MRRIVKRILSILLAFCLLLSIVPMSVGAATGGKTSVDAVAWAQNHAAAKSSLDYDGAYGAQCVDLIKYYYKYLGNSAVTGNGKDYATNTLPSGWKRIQYYSGFAPQPGDIAVWTTGGGGYGHVAIITSGNASTMSVVEQNWVGKYCSSRTGVSTSGIWGVIRPDFVQKADPSIAGAYWSNITETTFRPVVTINNPNTVQKVQFAVWTTGDQSDLKWYDANYNGVGSYFSDISFSNFSNKIFICHVYVYGCNGSVQSLEMERLDTNEYLKPNVKVIYWSNMTEQTFRPVIEINNPTDVKQVRFAVWTTGDQSDLKWYDANYNGLGAYFKDINYSDFQKQRYYCHVYVYGNDGSTQSIAYDTFDTYNAEGKLESATSGISTVTVSGYAFDRSDKKENINVHCYLIDSDGNAIFLGGIVADQERTDIDDNYSVGDYHGFSKTFFTSLSGTYAVEVSALNIGGGNAVTFLGSKKVTITQPKVYFDSCGGTNCETKTVYYGEAYGTLPIPSRAGYTFDGWYTNVSGGSKITKDSTVKLTNNQTLYAHWTCNHNYQGSIIKNATCIETGLKLYTCLTCGKSYEEVLPITSHNYNVTVIKPTCQKQGYNVHVCNVCGNSYTDNYVEVLSHDYSYELKTNPTETMTGSISGKCKNCSELISISLPTLNNEDYTYEVVKPAICNEKGIARYTWNNTAYGTFYFDIEVEQLEHNYIIETTKEPTCKETGEKIYTCEVCGATKIDIIEKLPCTIFSYTVNSIPTETIEGEMTLVCTVCGESTSEVLPNLYSGKYMYEIIEAYDCVNDGVVRYSWVGAFGQEFYFDVGTKALGHIFDDGICTRCGEKEIFVIASGYSGNTTWKLTDDGVLTFSGSGSMKNYTYKSEMPWYSYINDIKKIVLEDGVTTIGNYAFYGMPNLTVIEIPESVAIVGDYAFKNSTALDNVILPSKLNRLGDSAFFGCTSLTSIDIPASLYTVREYTFKNCTSLSSVTFHEGNLQKISDAAFYNTALTEVTLPDCLDILDVYVFKNCSKLADIKLSSSLTQIREASLYGTAISYIEIPEGVTKIGPYAFKNCTNLAGISLPTTLISVGEASFYACTALKEMVLPDAVTTIGNYAFRKCEKMAAVDFSANLETIGESSFYGCTELTTLVIPENVTEIQGYAFKGCIGLMEVSLPDSLIKLGESAFYGCDRLRSIVIPEKVTSIGNYTFSRCGVLELIEFMGDAPKIGTSAFSKVTATVYYPADNTTWTTEVMLDYGGTVTWVAK